MEFVTIGGYVLAIIAGIFGLRFKRGDLWKDEAEAYKTKAERLESDLNEFREEFNEYKVSTESRIDRLEIENKRLAELASSKDAVMALTDAVTAYHADVIAALAA